MATRAETFVVTLMFSAGLTFGCSSDDGSNAGTGGRSFGGISGVGASPGGGARATGGNGATAGGIGGSGSTPSAGASAGSAGNSSNGGNVSKASGGASAVGGASAIGGAAAGGKAAAGATTTGGATAAGAGGTALAGGGGQAGSSAGTTMTAGAAGKAGSAGNAGSGGMTCSAIAGTAGSGETRTIQSIIVSSRGQSCYDCALAYCSDALSNSVEADVIGSGAASLSCDNITGFAAAGPAACQSRKTLCYDALQCILQTKCVDINGFVSPCYCGTSTDCLGGVGTNGMCKAQEEAAHESTSAAYIAKYFGDLQLPVAGVRANQLVQCMLDARAFGGVDFSGDARCNSCFQ